MVPDNVTPGLVDETNVVFTCEGTTATPFSVSFTNMFVKEVPPTNPLIDDPLSFTALITELTGTGVTLDVLFVKFGSKLVPVMVAVLV